MDREVERGYWLPVDADPEIKANWISNADLSDSLKAILARHVLVVADSCYSGSLVRSVPETARAVDRQALLERLSSKRSRTVMTSGGLEPVADSGGRGHSVFARAFIDALAENAGIQEAQSLFGAIREKVVQNADQTPEYSYIHGTGHDGGDFLFVRR